ncbi:alpha/beta fold hydrolase [Kutzneria viridogrisea]|uniref:Triacylglycerol lipase n=2 Tax=Kutzneria TaxID=43356 RepID=W5WQA7_9PSEU|nr:alpha/beta fold hydrolase [Kutzneria albida]AHI00365.1 hypothetical protein KALB_7007 [Kutzneria albida DSM 43870]MBA8925541.1 triacylglycerol esterase/lipase EstA (alpha/beta hydrolase family) [Kutzneria viridogrisea]
MIVRLRALLSVAAAATLLSVAPAAPAQAATDPVAPDFATAFLYTQTVNPNAEAPGANDWSCRPSAAHPRPVVLVHGTWENQYNNFAKLSPALKKAGYCVYALNYGAFSLSLAGFNPAMKGTGDISWSAKELGGFIDRVLASTGTAKVDVVGHSQGGIVPRQYMRFEGGASKVHTLVTLGATNHGTTLSGIATLAGALGLLAPAPLLLGPAATQQVVGSDFITRLNAGGDTEPGVDYLVIATKYDEVTTPYQSTFLTAGPGATVRNVTLQDGCPTDLSEHVSMPYSSRAIGFVLQGLDPAAPAAPCGVNLPVL